MNNDILLKPPPKKKKMVKRKKKEKGRNAFELMELKCDFNISFLLWEVPTDLNPNQIQSSQPHVIKVLIRL